MVYANQQAYYDAITASTNAGQSGPFIDFMLNEIYKTLKAHQGEELTINNGNPIEKDFGINFGEEFGIKYGIKFGIKCGIKFGINEKALLLMLNSKSFIYSRRCSKENWNQLARSGKNDKKVKGCRRY